MTREERIVARRKMAADIANGNGPLDQVERFCRERKITSYWDFINAMLDEDTDLSRWALKSGRGQAARIRGIEARIAKVKRELAKGAMSK
mgnify:CR=1 FL=1